MNKLINKVFWISDKLYKDRYFNFPEITNTKFISTYITGNGLYLLPDIKSEIVDGFCGRFALVIDVKDYETKMRIKTQFLSNNIVDISELETFDVEKVKKQLEWILSDFGREKKFTEEDVFVISDTHFSHKNIIKYCNRPWNSGYDKDGNMIITEQDVDSMNEALIRNWNSVVGENDLVWHLGDFAFGKNKMQEIPEIVSRLNGKINLILGNHDKLPIKFYYDAGFNRVYDHPILLDKFLILSHEPVQWVKDGCVYGNCYGHVHSQEMYKHFTKNTFNCCVEVNAYKPIKLNDIFDMCNGVN